MRRYAMKMTMAAVSVAMLLLAQEDGYLLTAG